MIKNVAIALIAFSSLLIFPACLSQPRKEITFTIGKNRHYSNNSIIRFVKNGRLDFDFYVSPTWLYDEKASGFQPGWNKLIGISDGLNHHKNSVRIGWRARANKIELCAYCYIEGDRKISEATTADMGWNKGAVIISDTGYTVEINDHKIIMPRSGRRRILLMLYPYFGGRSKAPHDMEFQFRIH